MWYTFINWVKEKVFSCKMLWQKITRGYSDLEWWNLDSSICKYVAPRVKYLREHTITCPQGLTSDEWNNILADIEYWAENYSYGEFNWPDYESYQKFSTKFNYKVKPQECYDKFKRGKKYFFDYFENLWD